MPNPRLSSVKWWAMWDRFRRSMYLDRMSDATFQDYERYMQDKVQANKAYEDLEDFV